MSRAYVITENESHGVIDGAKVIAVKSNKKLAIAACVDKIGEGGIWSTKDKHYGKIIHPTMKKSVTYEMFYVNEETVT